MSIRHFPIFITIFLLAISCRQTPVKPSSRVLKEPVYGEKAMVVTEHPISTQVGIDILKKGGNAFDAAVAIQFAEAVVIPFAGNIGGGGFMVARKSDGSVLTLDYREKAPAAAHRDMYLDSAGNVITGLSWLGHLAAGVPGSVHGMFTLHDSLGSMPVAELIQPAIDLARKGFPITEIMADGLNAKLPDIREKSTMPNPFTAKESWQKGDMLIQPDMAHTLELIRDNGIAGFYEGETADKIVAEMERGSGIMTHEDLKNYRAVWREPIRGKYREYDVVSMPPPSSGGIALVQLLELIEPFDIGQYGFHSPEAIHLMVEAERRVYADRAEHLGDNDYYPVPASGLLEEEYLDDRMANFSPDSATDSEVISAGTPAPPESEETTHFSIVDPWGNAVAITTTINGGYGSCVVVGEAG
ncbi:MAG: gamma-glutamyltransferase, partial [Bacteroidetes bacterium]|nr:gamma-glutamyltransferase [Bacteroidota bacterium]